MNTKEILSLALREDWTCERVASELAAIGLSNKQISDLMKAEILKSCDERGDLEMNIYQRLNAAREQFHKLQLKKTGHNKFAGYHYFELGDFLIPAMQVLKENGIAAIVSFGSDLAHMTLVDVDNPSDMIVIESPMSSAALKGCHEVQNLGAVQTYLRRYLWVAALEIVEHDALDASEPIKEKSDIRGTAKKMAALDGIGDALDDGTKEVIKEWADEATHICRTDSAQACIAFLREKGLEGDERLYLDSKLPSDVRSAMRKLNQPK